MGGERADLNGHDEVPPALHGKPASPLSLCPSPATSMPWTESRIRAAKELADDIEHLRPRERELLKQSIDELLTDSPRADLAVVRFKRLIAKAGDDTHIALREILVLVVSDAVRRAIWGA